MYISHSKLSNTLCSLLQDGVDDSFHDKIRQATSEAQSSKREAFAETVRRQKAEKNALDAIKRVSFLSNVNWLAAMLVFFFGNG